MEADAAEVALNEWLRVQMDQRGWNQSDLAAELGVSPGTISRLLGGRTKMPEFETLDGLATILGVPLSEIQDLAKTRPAVRAPEPRPAVSAEDRVISALRADRTLTTADRKMVVRLYRRLRGA